MEKIHIRYREVQQLMYMWAIESRYIVDAEREKVHRVHRE